MERGRPQLKGIKKRWVLNYTIIVIIAMILFEIVLVSIVSSYYYNLITERLLSRARVSVGFYNKYVNTMYTSLNNIASQIIKDFPYREQMELQVLDLQGNIILSSTGYASNTIVGTNDYTKALQGEITHWRGVNKETGEKIVAVSGPLRRGLATVGVLRYVSSLAPADKVIAQYTVISLLVLTLISAMVYLLSMLFTQSVIKPIREIVKAARKMAQGHLNVQIEKHQDDEIGELAETLNYMASKMHESQQLKNDFVSSISHELRTPLTSIKGWSETVLSGGFEDKEEAEKGLRVITRETSRLTEMVEELLDFSRIEGGRLTLQREQVDLKKEIEDIVRIFTPRAVKQGVRLMFCPTHIPLIIGDKNRLRQVFINVLDNAIKFSHGGTEIGIEFHHEDNWVRIVVEDQGIGIAPDEISRVVEKFYKGNVGNAGSGLGLAISNEIIKLHKGELKIESKLCKGTIVTVVLPIEPH